MVTCSDASVFVVQTLSRTANINNLNIDPVNIVLAPYGFICLLIFKHVKLKEGGAKSPVKSIKFLCYMPPGGHKAELTMIYV